MRRTTGFHDDQPHIPVVEPAFKLAAGQPLLFDDIPLVIGNSDLEYTLGQINCNGSSMHFGLLSSKTDPHPHEHRHRLFGDEKTGESIPSVNAGEMPVSHLFYFGPYKNNELFRQSLRLFQRMYLPINALQADLHLISLTATKESKINSSIIQPSFCTAQKLFEGCSHSIRLIMLKVVAGVFNDLNIKLCKA